MGPAPREDLGAARAEEAPAEDPGPGAHDDERRFLGFGGSQDGCGDGATVIGFDEGSYGNSRIRDQPQLPPDFLLFPGHPDAPGCNDMEENDLVHVPDRG